jgi:phage terminase large subunit-like protein
VWQQEYLAEFIDWSGAAFFSQVSLLVDGRPVAYPAHCDAVFATIDTAVKDGSKHDGTAVTFWARSQFVGIPLIALDWDIIQIEGSLLEAWLPSVFQRLEQLAVACKARRGSLGAFIEDKNSGTILLQQARRRGWMATAIDSKLTDLGKDARAISVSGYVHRGWVKMSGEAYNRVTLYKGTNRNHLLGQVVGYRVGIDNKEDDLLDTFTYGIALALGDAKGF